MRHRETGRQPLSRCADARKLLDAFAENELAAEERRRVLGHLEICSTCTQELADYSAALAGFASVKPVEAPADLYAAFGARLDRLEARRRRLNGSLRWAASAACLVAVVGAGALTIQAVRGRSATTSEAPRMAAIGRPAKVVAPPPDAREDPFSPKIAAVPDEKPKPKRNQPPPDRFEDVQDESGQSLRSLLHRRVASAEPIPGPWDRIADFPEDRKPVSLAPAIEERIRVGDAVAYVKGESGYDSKGRLAVIRLDAGVEPLDPSDPPTKRMQAPIND